MAYVLVGLGGALGSVVRYSLGKFISRKLKGKFPYGTFIINITGAFLLGAVSSVAAGTNWYVFLAEGFLGAYTTFSTFMYEGFNLFLDKEKLNAITYIIISLILGLLGFELGNRIFY